MSNKGKFIVIEGTDGSGKATQTKLLEKYLTSQGVQIKTDDYPHYDQFWGKLVKRMLTNDLGELFSINPYLAVLPYMLDEYFGGLKIAEWVKQGKFVLSNRYFTSNVHQVVKLKGQARAKFRDWLWQAGWQEAKLYKPDLVLVLMVKPVVCRKLYQKRGHQLDAAEKNRKHQLAAYKEYQRMCAMDQTWVQVACCDQAGQLLPAEIIHTKLVDVLKGHKFIR